MSAREVAVVLARAKSDYAVSEAKYSVRVRRRVLGVLWWGAWRKVIVGAHEGVVELAEAQALADQALENGWVETYAGNAEPLIGKQEE